MRDSERASTIPIRVTACLHHGCVHTEDLKFIAGLSELELAELNQLMPEPQLWHFLLGNTEATLELEGANSSRHAHVKEQQPIMV